MKKKIAIRLTGNSIWQKLILPILILAISILIGSVACALDEKQFEIASMLTKYKEGYLVSIVPKGIKLNSQGLEKYLVNVQTEQEGWVYRPIDKNDYLLIESKFKFRLKDKIIFFGSWYRDNLIMQGQSYYLKYNEVGAGTHIEDIMLFVKGTEELEKILPIWAKKYSADDETYKWIESRAINIINFGNENTALLENIHNYSGAIIKQKAKDDGIKYPIFDFLNEYKEEIYSVNLNSTSNKNYLIVVNGVSHIKNIKFCTVFVIDKHMKKKDDIVPLEILQDDRGDYLDNSFALEHIYHSKKSGQYLIIGTHKGGLGYATYLIYYGDNKIIKKPIFIQSGC